MHSLFFLHKYDNEKLILDYLNTALKLAKKSNYKKGLTLTYMYFGYFYEDHGDYSKALSNYLICLEMQQSEGNKKGIAKSFDNIGNVYSNQGNYSEVLKK